jgi:hypothetical protein
MMHSPCQKVYLAAVKLSKTREDASTEVYTADPLLIPSEGQIQHSSVRQPIAALVSEREVRVRPKPLVRLKAKRKFDESLSFHAVKHHVVGKRAAELLPHFKC